ncbi:uncharacterized protein PFL1_06497 [Pseudozyma flocculosa PF-1]|uniref:STAS domain-containing protein n=1 Tax=Pseudozyma flocculosa PF-1 TaxID=1277687 RepID=A0A061H1R2_9BASI|nr:uncharacterized protein PFL1_06497 [Pseudozyma flocculosa PF-1]EPQ26044.1 hypothetical protein PFL1_06497 [Pseudozyma flocculosa PF-1]
MSTSNDATLDEQHSRTRSSSLADVQGHNGQDQQATHKDRSSSFNLFGSSTRQADQSSPAAAAASASQKSGGAATFDFDTRRPRNAYDPNSPGGQAPARKGKMFPRSVTFEPNNSSFPPNTAKNRSRMSSYHPTQDDSPYDESVDLERQGSGGGSGISSGNNRASNSAFSHLEGRSYRFQPAQDAGSLSASVLSGSYTATSGTIRDSTAHLAEMMLMSDEEGASMNGSRIYDIGEEEDDELISVTRLPDSISPTASQPATPGTAQTGPSNLSRAMAASRGTSPESGKTLAAEDGSEATPRLFTPILGMAQQPVATPMSTGEAAEDYVGPAGERTPLLGVDPGTKEAQGRGRQGSSLAPSRAHASTSRSRSDSRQGRRSQDFRDRATSVDRSSSIGAADSSTFSQFSESARAGIGYGALAQAEQSVIEHRVPPHRRPSQPLGYPCDEAEELLSPAWALVPRRFRPGAGEQGVRKLTGPRQHLHNLTASMRKLTWQTALEASAEPVRLLPAVILGMLMNVLDGVSYGMIMFPASYPIFSNFGGDGVSMFFLTCVLSQLVYTLGGSIFKGGNGSMMIETVPFFHILVKIIIDTLGDEDRGAIVATTMVAFALSSILIGLAFFLLGALRLGVLIGFFPRHILVGCIGGVGIFLIETGLEVCGQLKSEEGFQYNLETLRYFFQSGHMVALWLPPLLLAVLLRLITARFHHPFIFPGYFLMIPVVFYIVAVGILRVPMSTLREQGWVFDIGESASQAPFYRFYTYFDFRQTSFRALWATMPTQLALVFFGILHVPLNVPALGVSINEDNVDTDRELVAHGISNVLAGLIGTVPNYLCYVNSVLFYRVGGGSRLSGLMLAAGTSVIMIAGPGTISYMPVMIVGALIFVLGIDLAKEALYDTVGRVNGWEYWTIWVIVIVMTYWDFVYGILAGIIIACCFFVVQTSRRKTVRAIFDGSVARSTVRRHMTQRHFLDEVGTQTQIIKLQGFLFFGTINSVENLIRRALDIAAWNQNPIRFLIVDFTLVSGVDFSAAEAFTRINRLLLAKDVVLVFCGLQPDGDVGVALRSVGLWADQSDKLEVFANLNEALEWTENEYLRGLYASDLMAAKAFGQASLAAAGGLDVPDQKRRPAFVLDQSFENSPRRHHLHEAAKTAVRTGGEASLSAKPPTSGTPPPARAVHAQPVPILLITFRAYLHDITSEEDFIVQLAPYFQQVRLTRGEVLWSRGDPADGFYLIESGILKARYDFPQEQYEINEAMLAGTIAGELTFLAERERNTTVHAELDATLWKLDTASLQKMRDEKPAQFGQFVKVLLRIAGEEQESLMSYLVSRLS